MRMMITPAQCRAARALLDWTQENLAKESKVSKRTILHFEKASGRQPLRISLDAIQRALEAAGVEFTNGDQPGVRMKK
jgi:transcriptional regulator with XRE-family HTH domain